MVGFFDSGSGGLSVLTHFLRLAPKTDVIYFGDIQNAPYGEKSPEELASLTTEGIALLHKRGADSIVSACNSVSTSILRGATGPTPFVEMSIPTGEYMRQFFGKKFLLIATPATVASKLYANALLDIVELDSLGVPELAGAIEFGEPKEKIISIARQALETKKGNSYHGIILGCTHYPLALSILTPLIDEIFGIPLIIDPGIPVAEAASARFRKEESGSVTFLISMDSKVFRERVKEVLQDRPYTIEVV